MIKLVDLLLEAPIKQVVPEFLYHATYEALIPSIKRTGLDSREGELSWEFSIPGTVYLANDPDVAESYAEAAEEVSDEVYDSGIVVLKVASKDLDIDKLFDDSNVQDDFSDTFEYKGVISWSMLSIYKMT
tara:strand:+ start:26 stop:415 length:390 start_codon:yes stop_codon:yes gene_type:complete